MQEMVNLAKRRAVAATSTRAVPAAQEEREELRQRGGGIDVKEAKRVLPKLAELVWIDQFPYFPAYKYHAYRSTIGAFCSFLMGFVFFLRVVTSGMDFTDLPPVIPAHLTRTLSSIEFPPIHWTHHPCLGGD